MFIPAIVIGVACLVGVVLVSVIMLLWQDTRILEGRISKLNCEATISQDNVDHKNISIQAMHDRLDRIQDIINETP